MSLSLRDLEEEAFGLHDEAATVESNLVELYETEYMHVSEVYPMKGNIGSFDELRFVEFGEMWAKFSLMLSRMLNFCRMVRENAEEVLREEVLREEVPRKEVPRK